MRICDLTQAYTATSGGVRTYVEEKRRFLAEHTEHEHVLVIPGERDEIVRDGRLTTCRVRGPEIPGAEPYRLPLRLDKVYGALRATAPDIVEVGTPFVMPLPAIRFRSRHPASRLVGFYHMDFSSIIARTVVLPMAGAAASRFSERRAEAWARWVYRRCDAVLVGSPPLVPKLQGLGISTPEYVPLGVDLDTFHPARRSPEIRRELGYRDRDVVMLYAGRLDHEKRALLLLEAFRGLSEAGVRLLLVGNGARRAEVEEQARTDPRVRVLPFEPDRLRLATLMASADIYVTASPHETFGLSVVEAQACGLPVLGVRAGAMTDRVDSSTGVLVEPDSVAALRAGMVTLLQRDHRACGRRARRRVEHRFGWQRTFRRLFEIYARLHGGPAPPLLEASVPGAVQRSIC